jgi:hypothetical protein
MTEHFHDRDNVIAWGRQQMASHLWNDHGIRVPMAWDLPHQLNAAHLKAHQAPVNRPEETPVPDLPDHSHGDIARWHDRTPLSVLMDHLAKEHSEAVVADPEVVNAYGTHAAAHARGFRPSGPAEEGQVCGAVNPDMVIVTCTYPAGHGPIVDPEMVDSDYPMRGEFDHGNAPGEVWWTVPKAEPEPLTGVVQPPTLADQVRVLEEQLAEAVRDRTQVAVELERRVETVTGQRDRAIRAGQILERERDAANRETERLRQQFQIVIAERDRVRDARVEVEGERDRALAALEEARQNHGADLDRLGARVHTLTRLLEERTQALDLGRHDLRDWVTEIRGMAEGTPGPDFIEIQGNEVIERIEKILGEPVSTAGPIVLRAVPDPDEAPQMDLTKSQGLRLTVPKGTRDLMLTFLPEEDAGS